MRRVARINPNWVSAPFEYIYIVMDRVGAKIIHRVFDGNDTYAPRYATLEDAKNETNPIFPFEYADLADST